MFKFLQLLLDRFIDLFAPKPYVEEAPSLPDDPAWVDSLNCLLTVAGSYKRVCERAGVASVRISKSAVPRADILTAIVAGGIEHCGNPFDWIPLTDSTILLEGTGLVGIFSHAGGSVLFPNAENTHLNHENAVVEDAHDGTGLGDSDAFIDTCLSIINDPQYRAFLAGKNSDWVMPRIAVTGTPPHIFADLQNTVLNIVNTIRIIEEKEGTLSSLILNMTLPIYLVEDSLKLIHATFPHLEGNVNIVLGSGFWRRHLV